MLVGRSSHCFRIDPSWAVDSFSGPSSLAERRLQRSGSRRDFFVRGLAIYAMLAKGFGCRRRKVIGDFGDWQGLQRLTVAFRTPNFPGFFSNFHIVNRSFEPLWAISAQLPILADELLFRLGILYVGRSQQCSWDAQLPPLMVKALPFFESLSVRWHSEVNRFEPGASELTAVNQSC